MVRVGVVIEAARIVKQRGKTHHRKITPFRRHELKSIAFHAEPVGEAWYPFTPPAALRLEVGGPGRHALLDA